ncbi:MAG TPA: hypothetical protein VN428_02355 [Bryobacteraceae bacterium]|nr:hypothetical protein [Bryobacteraceae bacterium]
MAETVQPDQILALLKEPLTKLIHDKVDAEVTHEKQRQYQRLRKAHEYYNGRTYLVPDASAGYMDWASVRADSPDSTGLYDYHIDIVKSYGRKYFGVLGLRPFHNAKAMPDDPQSEVDRSAARQAELGAAWCKHKWNARIRNIEVFFLQWKAGTVYAYTPYVADEGLFGTVSEPEYVERIVEVEPGGYRCNNCGAKSPEPEISTVADDFGNPIEQSVCPQCKAPLSDINFEEPVTASVPELVGHKSYPGSGPALRLCTGYTVTLPFDCKQVEKAPVLSYEYEEDRGVLFQLYSDTLRKNVDERGELRGSGDETSRSEGVQARGESASLTGTQRYGRQTRWTHTRTWLATSYYEYIDDKNQRALLYEKFPDGLKVSMVEGLPLKLENEAVGECWSAIEPEPNDFLYHDPVCWGILGHQDVVNDVVNIEIARQERGLPSALVDPDVVDIDAINSKPHLPKELIAAKAGAGSRLSDAVQTIPTPQGESRSGELLSTIDANVQQHTGILPPVWGGGAKQETAEGMRTQLNQAMMQLGVPGEYAMQGWAAMFTKAVKLIAKYAPKSFAVAVPNGKGITGEMLDIEALRAGNWHFEVEPSVPMSWAEKRDILNGIIQENPAVASALGLDQAINVEVVRDYLLPNTPELQIPGDDTYQYAIGVIEQLLQQEAVEGEGPNGPELMPSIPPQDFVEDPAAMADAARLWLISESGRKAAKDNPTGWRNVVAWGMAQQAKVPPMMPPGPNGEPQGEPQGPPPPDTQQPQGLLEAPQQQ